MRKIIFIFLTIAFLWSDSEVIVASDHNPIEINTFDFASHSRRNYAVANKNGAIGIVYRAVKSISPTHKMMSLEYTSLKEKKTSVVFQKKVRVVPKMRYYLTYDVKQQPLIFVDQQYSFYSFHREKGSWKKSFIPVPFTRRWNGQYVQKIKLAHIFTNEEHTTYLLFHLTVAFKTVLIVGNDGKNFYPIENTPQKLKRVLDFDVDAKGTFNLLYNRNSHLCYATIDNNNWKEEIIERGSSSEVAGWEAHLAKDKNRKLHVASTFVRVVSSGSLVNSQLHWHQRIDFKKWKTEKLATSSKGYSGRDGSQYTGASPYALFDKAGRPHIIFNDIASWHSGPNNDFTEGNLRYIYKTQGKWQQQILYRQDGQSTKRNSLQEFLYPNSIISGNIMHFFGVEKITEGSSTRYGSKNNAKFSLLHLSQPLRK